MASDNLTLYLSLSSSPSTPRIKIEISTKTTLSDLRTLVSTESKIPLSSLKLIYRGRLMQPQNADDNVVETYSLEDECVLHCIGKPGVNATSDISSGSTVSGSTMTATSSPSIPPPTPSTLPSAISLLKTSSDPKTAINTLLKIISNITSHPMEEKYRTIKSTNAAFQRKVGGIPGGKECMKAMGFELVNEEDKLNATAEAWTKLVECKNTFEQELKVLSAANIPPPAPSQPTPSNPTASMMQNLLSNPQMLQQAMRNNPMMNHLTPQQQQMLNNPAMMQQLSQYMSQNPQMMQDMQRRYQAGVPQPAQQSNATQNTSQQQGDDGMTEEEMIAEAIARSLRE